MNKTGFGSYIDGFAITASDSLDIKDDIGNLAGVEAVFVHNPGTSGTVRVMPAGINPPLGFTLTGSSGTANITINGVAYLATFASTLTVTATNFVSSHDDTLKALGITVTSNGARLIFTGANTAAIANVSGNLSGTALAAVPITIYIAQGATSEIAVKRVYASTPTPPTGIIGYHIGKKG